MAYTLNAQNRTITGSKVKTLRMDNQIPTVLYGYGLKESKSLQINFRDFEKVYEEAGESQVIELTVESDKPVNVLVRDIQINPLSREVIHADFQSIDITKPVEVEIPINYMGVAPGVKATGGSLIKKLSTVHATCLPKDLVKAIEVSLEKLATLEDKLLVSDIIVPSGITILTDQGNLLASVIPPRVEVEPTPAAEGEEDAEGEEGETAAEDGEEKKEEKAEEPAK